MRKKLLSFILAIIMVMGSLQMGSILVNAEENVVWTIAPIYDDVAGFYNGVALAKQNSKWGLIDRVGNEVASFIYDDVSGFSNSEGLARVEGYVTNGRGSVNGVQKENVIILFSNFNTGEQSGNDGFNPNSHYTNWMWILIRDNAESSWQIDDWRY